MIDSIRLLRWANRHRHRPALIGDLLFDLQRVLLLAWTLAITALPSLLRRMLGIREHPAVIGARIRRSLQRLGITYIKLGQFLAMRFDILPEEVCRELARLFDAVPPMSTGVVRETLEAEFAKSVEELFRSFEWQCIAAASVAQVHKAITHDGTVIAVKVQRPGIERIFSADIRNFRRAARLGDYLKLLGPQSMVGAVNEFERYTRREMDFITEGRTADRLRLNAGRYDSAPLIYWELTTSRVLTMEFIEGFPLSDIIHLIETGQEAEIRRRAPGLDLQRAVQNFSRACLRQLFVTGFFHADPHPGNVFLREDSTVVFVDFGIFGQLTAERRETFASYIENVAVGNIEQSYRHFIRLLQPTPQTDMQHLQRDVHRIMHRWHKASQQGEAELSERHLGTYFTEFIEAIRRNQVQMSMDTLLFWRAILTLDATALRFGSQFDLLSALRDFFQKTRPTPLERLMALLTDREVAMSLNKIKQEMPAQIEALVGDLSLSRHQLPVLKSSSPHRKLRSDDNARLLALIIAGSSLLVISVKLPLNVLGQTLLWTATLSLAAAILVRLVRD
jgi:ubiquinone biosynthesis protein